MVYFQIGFTFNAFLLVDEHPLLFHTSMRGVFPIFKKAVESVLKLEKLRYISFSHHEADEDGAINEWLDAAPNAQPVCSKMFEQLHLADFINGKRAIVNLEDGQELSLGKHTVFLMNYQIFAVKINLKIVVFFYTCFCLVLIFAFFCFFSDF